MSSSPSAAKPTSLCEAERSERESGNRGIGSLESEASNASPRTVNWELRTANREPGTGNRLALALLLALSLNTSAHQAVSANQPGAEQMRLYRALKAFALTGGSVNVRDFALTRDRVDITLTGTLFFAGTVDNRVTGAVFIGQGSMKAEVPPSAFEQDHVRRMIGADLVESDFRTAVLRWTDDTYDVLGGSRGEGGPPPAEAQQIASEFEARLTHDTGVNLASRLAVSLLNGETPGLFFTQFDGGRRGRFNVLVDHQHRIPVSHFGINGGEKGVIFSYTPIIFSSEIWMAFYSADDYARGTATYSDVDDLVDLTHYDVRADLTEPEQGLRLTARIDMSPQTAGVRALPLMLGEGLSTFQDQRLEKQLRVSGVRLGGEPVAWSQEDWESGFTVYLPEPLESGRPVALEVDIAGKFLQSNDLVRGAFYPVSNTAWLPRHGYLDRATFNLTYTHRTRDKVASVGIRASEAPDPSGGDRTVTTYRMPHPVALVVFALGPFERHAQEVTFEAGGEPVRLEFSKMPDSSARIAAVKEDFVLAELDNSVRYFAAMFGRYPYETFGAAFHPYGFGQGFPTMMMLAPADQAATGTFQFISHETAHQWWGNIVAWRSYRDQWLSEGFANYSSLLYTGLREDREGAERLLRNWRRSLVLSPRTLRGAGRGRLDDIGPIILGLRLNSTESAGAYQALVYNKGALVLRMLHFLLSDPARDPIASGDSGFQKMMSAFVERHRNGAASTDDFRAVANEHFRASPVALRTGMSNLNWFFLQWVYRTGLPSYRLEYAVEDRPDGGAIVRGTLHQESVPDDFFMALPVVLTFDGDRQGRALVTARGPSTPVEIRVASRPKNVELDPESWILSETTGARKR